MKKDCSLNVIYTCGAPDVYRDIQVGEFRVRLGYDLGIAAGHLPEIDYVVPVPNSGLYYAMGFGMATGIPYLQAIVKDNDALRSLHQANHEQRKLEIEKNLVVLPSLLEGKNIALIDEAIFSGTTLSIVTNKLHRSGAKAIHIFIPTPPCMNACERLPQKDLIVNRMTDDQLCRFFEADSINFASSDTFQRQTHNFEGFCMGCFKGCSQNE